MPSSILGLMRVVVRGLTGFGGWSGSGWLIFAFLSCFCAVLRFLSL